MKRAAFHSVSSEFRSDALLSVAAKSDRVVVLAHNNPDPDAISSGWAIIYLIQERLKKPATFIAHGEIVRAENQKMVRLLHPPLQLNQPLLEDPSTLLVLVDCDEKSTNHPAVHPNRQPVAVIDHHVEIETQAPSECVFLDLRPDVASTAALAASYLREQKVLPSEHLATALLYGIRTETTGGETHYSALDKEMLVWLTDLAEPSLLAQIEDATVALPYFGNLSQAFDSTLLYGNAAFCVLPQCQGPESVGEIADLLLRCEGVKNVFCAALFRGNLIVSVRTKDPSINAAHTVNLVLLGFGHGGGHSHRAGGMIKNVDETEMNLEELFAELRWRFLKLCRVDSNTGLALVKKPEG